MSSLFILASYRIIEITKEIQKAHGVIMSGLMWQSAGDF